MNTVRKLNVTKTQVNEHHRQELRNEIERRETERLKLINESARRRFQRHLASGGF